MLNMGETDEAETHDVELSMDIFVLGYLVELS